MTGGISIRPASAALFAVPVLGAAQQLCLKLAADSTGLNGTVGHWLAVLLSGPWFAAAGTAEILCFVFWMMLLAEMEISRAFPLSSASYVLTMLIGWLGFGEHLHPASLLGSCLILTGLWCVAEG